MRGFDPVPFDFATARRAADACRTAATRVLDVAGDRRRLATTAQQEWRGPHRHAFDWDVVELTVRSETLAADLRGFATTIDAAIDRADAENRRREEAAP